MKCWQYKQGVADMETRLAGERETSRRLAMTLAEAVSSQEAMQQLEEGLKKQLATLETQLSTARDTEDQLRSQLQEAKLVTFLSH
jgi:hypothetical protein